MQNKIDNRDISEELLQAKKNMQKAVRELIKQSKLDMESNYDYNDFLDDIIKYLHEHKEEEKNFTLCDLSCRYKLSIEQTEKYLKFYDLWQNKGLGFWRKEVDQNKPRKSGWWQNNSLQKKWVFYYNERAVVRQIDKHFIDQIGL